MLENGDVKDDALNEEEEIKEEKKNPMYEEFDFKAFWKKNKYKILAGCVGLGYLVLNAKIKTTYGYIDKKYNKLDNKIGEYMNSEIVPKITQLHRDTEDLFDNSTIVKNDINNLATHTGYQGKLGVNHVFE